MKNLTATNRRAYLLTLLYFCFIFLLASLLAGCQPTKSTCSAYGKQHNKPIYKQTFLSDRK